MFPVEIWIVILFFVPKYEILNIRLTSKYLLSVINTFCILELNKLYKKNFILIDRKIKQKSIFIDYLQTFSSNNILKIIKISSDLNDFKLIISENYQGEFYIDSLIDIDKTISIEKIGEKQNYICDFYFTYPRLLKVKNFTFNNSFINAVGYKIQFKNCFFKSGLAISEDLTILKKCEIIGYLEFHFCGLKHFKNTNGFKITNIIVNNKFYNYDMEIVNNFEYFKENFHLLKSFRLNNLENKSNNFNFIFSCLVKIIDCYKD